MATESHSSKPTAPVIPPLVGSDAGPAEQWEIDLGNADTVEEVRAVLERVKMSTEPGRS